MLASMGLWMAGGSTDTDHHCKAFHRNQTFFGRLQWRQELDKIEAEVRSIRDMRNNTPFKFQHKANVFLYYDTGRWCDVLTVCCICSEVHATVIISVNFVSICMSQH